MALPTDTQFANQWHLNNTTPGLLDLNIVGANGVSAIWDDYTGAGVDVFVFDDGFEYTHSDLSTNYDTARDFDYGTDTADALGDQAIDFHGTAVMGIIGAERDGTGAVGVGVAYDSNLIGIRDFGDNINTFQLFFSTLDTIFDDSAAAGADVINISQGLANTTSTIFADSLIDFADIAPLRASIENAVVSGRDGLGTVIVKSAGNSRTANYDTNASPWSNNTNQVVVAAVDQDGFVSSYSSFGASNLVSGFGTPGEVVTTDRLGANGYSTTDFTSTFNGTSSAAPMVSGVVSLMLEANSSLGWRDIQDILSYSARHVGSAVDDVTTAGSERTPWHFNAATDWNGGGLHYSMDYGYGLVDAHAAVRMAEVWNSVEPAHTSANEFVTFEDDVNGTFIIPDGDLNGTTFTINELTNINVERVTLDIAFSTTFLADMQIYIKSPTGVEHMLIRDQAGGNNFDNRWIFESQAFRGETSAGDWEVRVVDAFGGDVLTVTDIDLRTYGSSIGSSVDHQVFTNEYSDYAGGSGHVTNFVGVGAGAALNAAAVTSNTTIRLDVPSSSTIDGINISTTNFDRVFTGDGNDIVVADNGGVAILTGRGNDSLTGGTGNDTLDGGTGSDSLAGGFGDDTYVLDSYGDVVTEAVGQGFDTIQTSFNVFVTAGAEIERIETTNTAGTDPLVLVGNEFSQSLVGNEGNNILSGLAGIDFAFGYGGNDIYVVDNALDQIFEVAGEGAIDAVFTTVDYTLQAGVDVERMVATLFSSTNDIALTGNEVAQVMVGNQGSNTISGAGGNDSLYGFGGNDFLESGAGNDSLYGGTGFDTFLFSEVQGTAGGIDRIYDLTAADDIRIDSVAQVGLVALTANQFQIGTAANDAADRVIYDDTSGVFWFDADGNGAGAAILLGVVNGAPQNIDHTFFELI